MTCCRPRAGALGADVADTPAARRDQHGRYRLGGRSCGRGAGGVGNHQHSAGLRPHAPCQRDVTLTVNDIATAVPQVNAEFAKLGINATAIPVTPNCTVQDGASSALMAPDESLSMSESITIGNAYIPAGLTAVIAAEQTSSGVRLSMGTTNSPLPSCLNSNQAAPVITPGN